MVKRIIALGAFLVTSTLNTAAAAPTPIPGGANAISALSSTLGQAVFNGVLRIQIVELREATADDSRGVPYPPTPTADQKVMFIRTLLHNGTHDEWTGLIRYTLADKDAVSVDVPTNSLTNPAPHILQGAAARQSALFLVDKDFAPTKLVVTCQTCASNSGFRSIRFAVAAH